MIELGALFGTGDVYLTCALARAVRDTHHDEVTVIVKPGHEAIARLFPGLNYRVENMNQQENDRHFHATYDNRIRPGHRVYVHPVFLQSDIRVDYLCLVPRISHAHMFKAILHLDMDADVDRGVAHRRMSGGNILIMPRSKSWPNSWPQFWDEVIQRTGGQVVDDSWSLEELFTRIASADTFIGPQCGVSMIVAHAQFACRKIICSMDFEHAGFPGLPQKRAAPYCFSDLFAGEIYDMEEILVTSETSRAANKVMLALTRQQTGQVLNMPQINVNVGEFIDRWLIAMTKEERLGRRTDFNRLDALVRYYAPPQELVDRLAAANLEEWDVIERINHAFSGGTLDAIPGDHVRAVELNRVRVGIKNEINKTMKSSPEVKSHD